LVSKKKHKKKRNMGQSYHTANNKKLINAKKIKLACGNICRLECSLSISEISRQQLFNYYWQLGNVDRQRDFYLNALNLAMSLNIGILIQQLET